MRLPTGTNMWNGMNSNVKTVARHVARYSNNVRSSEEAGNLHHGYDFRLEGNCTITEADGSEFPVSEQESS